MNMREKIARAISDTCDTDSDGTVVNPSVVVDAVLDAMDEPDEAIIEAAAWAMAAVIAKRHGSGHTAQEWMGEARREEARAAFAVLAAAREAPQ